MTKLTHHVDYIVKSIEIMNPKRFKVLISLLSFAISLKTMNLAAVPILIGASNYKVEKENRIAFDTE